MTRDEFDKLRDEHYRKICEINATKGHDYAGSQDALANFKEQAAALGLTPEQVWGVFAGKHWAAIMTFIREGDVQSEPIEGRIHDVILYCFLLLGLIEEKKGGDPAPLTPLSPPTPPFGTTVTPLSGGGGGGASSSAAPAGGSGTSDKRIRGCF